MNILKLNRKQIVFVSFMVVVLGIVFLSFMKNVFAKEEFRWKLAVVETNLDEEKSWIHFFDSALMELDEIFIDKGGMNINTNSNSLYSVNDGIYLVPAGITGEYKWRGIEYIGVDADKKNDVRNIGIDIDKRYGIENIRVDIDKKNDIRNIDFNIDRKQWYQNMDNNIKRHTYDIGQQMIMDYSVDNDSIYAANSIVSEEEHIISYLSVCNLINDKVVKYEIEDLVINTVDVYGDEVILTGFNYKADGELFSKLLIYDKISMKLKKDINIEEYGINISDIIYNEGEYYLAPLTKTDSTGYIEEEADRVFCIDDNYKIKTTDMKTSKYLHITGDKLIGVYNDTVSEITRVTEYDFKDKHEREYILNTKCNSVCFENNNMFILGDGEIAEYNLQDECKEIIKTEIDCNKRNDTYYTCLVLNKD